MNMVKYFLKLGLVCEKKKLFSLASVPYIRTWMQVKGVDGKISCRGNCESKCDMIIELHSLHTDEMF